MPVWAAINSAVRMQQRQAGLTPEVLTSFCLQENFKICDGFHPHLDLQNIQILLQNLGKEKINPLSEHHNKPFFRLTNRLRERKNTEKLDLGPLSWNNQWPQTQSHMCWSQAGGSKSGFAGWDTLVVSQAAFVSVLVQKQQWRQVKGHF